MTRAKKGQQKVSILKKTTGLCPSISYYYYDLFTATDNTGTYIFLIIKDYTLIYMLDKSSVLLLFGLAQ